MTVQVFLKLYIQMRSQAKSNKLKLCKHDIPTNST